MIEAWKILLISICTLVLGYFLANAFTYLRYYWTNRFQYSIEEKNAKRKHELNVQIVIGAYGAFASEDNIKTAIAVVRELEEKYAIEPYDFTEEEKKYQKQLKEINERGYL